ncbi:PKD domain-containing protein [Archangium sp.]|uniref:RCC1 domain-containing protein n=1 Tax=Archangium sp. TaxID=1872627 RepID=UPI00389AB758
MTRMRKHVWLYLTASLLALAVGCGAPPQQEEDSTGSAQLFGTTEQAITSADVTSVRVTVSAADMPARTSELVKTNNQWSGLVGKLPAGTGRTFSAEAFNSSGTKLYAGSATSVTILARQTTAVSITLQEVSPAAPFSNAAPIISSLSAAPGTVEPGGSVTLNASASDANPGDTLTYAWSAPSGTFAQAASLSTTWTAPAAAATVPLTLTVTDSKGLQGKVTFNVNVTSGKGDAAVNASLNTWPQVGNLSASTTALEVNDSTTVSATASDNDGDTLAYSWTSSCTGTWSNATSATAQFTATALPGSNVCNNCNLTVTVTDFRNGQAIGGQTTGTLSLCVGPKKTALFPPDITETFQSAASTSANGTVTFRVKAVDPQSSAMSFSWASNTGTTGSPTTSASTSDVVWTAPACVSSGTSPTVTATVTNALGLSANTAFTVSGLPACSTAPAAQVLDAGDDHTVMLKPDGTVWAWGYNGYGQLGDGTTGYRGTPSQVPGLSNIISIAAGSNQTLALKQDGTVWSWGSNVNGQLGDGTSTSRASPVQVTGLSNITAISAGGVHSLALKQDGTLWAWGANGQGQLGDGTTNYRASPIKVPGLSNITALSAGYLHSLALKQDGTLWAWGYNQYGPLGDGTTTNRSSPVQVSGLSNIIAISAGTSHSVALKQDGTVWAWGYNSYGQLGDGTTTNRSSPVQVPGLSNIIALTAGNYHSLALKQDGNLWAWGYNVTGQLGDGTTTQRTSPVQVSGLSNITALSTGQYHTVALKQDGTVWSWGYNQYGQLGNGTSVHRIAPSQLPGLSNIISTAAVGHVLAVKQDGTLWAWGSNYNGQLGDGTTTQRTSPSQVPGLSNVIAVSAGQVHSLALKQDGTVWAWGNNSDGQLGDGNTIGHFSPVLVPGLSNLTAISAGISHTLALKQDGTVWAWGLNDHGQLGDGSTTRRTSPVQVPGLSNPIAITATFNYSLAVKQDGTLLGWGNNNSGLLGNGGVPAVYSSPIQSQLP